MIVLATVSTVLLVLGLVVVVANVRAVVQALRTFPLATFGSDGEIRARVVISPRRWGRYPDPASAAGAVEVGTVLRAMTYARLARERARNYEMASEAVIVVGGAALGVTVFELSSLATASLMVVMVGVLLRIYPVAKWQRVSVIYEERARVLGAGT